MEKIDTKTWKKIKAKRVLKEWRNFLYGMKMCKKILKFDNIEVNKKKFHVSKQPITLDSVLINKIVVSDKFEHSDRGFKNFICCKDDNIDIMLCVILP